MTLATKYGDRIVKIFKKQRDGSHDDYFGYITNDSVFVRTDRGWSYKNEDLQSDAVIDKLKKWDK